MHLKKAAENLVWQCSQLCWRAQWAAWTKLPIPQRRSPEIFIGFLPTKVYGLVFYTSEVTSLLCIISTALLSLQFKPLMSCGPLCAICLQ